MTTQFKGQTFEHLKSLIKPGKCPSQPVLRNIEEFLMNLQRELYYDQRVLTDLDDLALDFLVECGIVDNVVVSFRNMPGFLLNPEKIVRIWMDREHTNFITAMKTDIGSLDFQATAIQDEDGEYYTTDNKETYYREKANGLTREPVSCLSWRLPPVEECAQCHARFVKSVMVYNPRLMKRVDKWCHVTINEYQHPRQDMGTPITSYHSHRGSWVFYPATKGMEKSIPMGVEIEMHNKYSNSSKGATFAARQILAATEEEYPHYYFETDGSLSEGGFEMITNPMTLEFGTEWWHRMLPLIRKHCVGYGVEKLVFGKDHDNGATASSALNYGIHITVARSNVPDIIIPKLQRFFDDSRNKEFIYAIAQRNVMYGGYHLGSKDNPNAKSVLPWHDKNLKTLQNQDRRSPINIKGITSSQREGLIEFRMFRSTLNTVSFLKNLEFIDAITSYYKEQMSMNTDHRAFIGYLLDNARRYPNLIEYLTHPLYFVKGCGVVKNTWLPLITGVKVKKFDPLHEYGPPLNQTDATDLSETAAVQG